MFTFKKKNKKYDSSTIADYIIAYYASNDKENINVTKTLKILYLTYGIYLYKNKEVLFDEIMHNMNEEYKNNNNFKKIKKSDLKYIINACYDISGGGEMPYQDIITYFLKNNRSNVIFKKVPTVE